METDHRQAAQRRHATLCQEDALAAWCARWLGAPPSVLFEVAHLSIVTGLRLGIGQQQVPDFIGIRERRGSSTWAGNRQRRFSYFV